MGQVLARFVMWGFIVASVWYLAREYGTHQPTKVQQQGMEDAARHYRTFQEAAHIQAGGDLPQISTKEH